MDMPSFAVGAGLGLGVGALLFAIGSVLVWWGNR